jgi:poly-gamma-glutamate synthesis protein (capsule biosynthesis protein)
VGRAIARLRAADLAFGNLEGSLTRSGAAVEKLMTLRMDPDCAAHLRAMGFVAMGVANNHALDYGSDAFLESQALLRANGIVPAGGGRDLAEAWEPAIVDAKGVRIAFLAAASTLPPGSAAGEGRPGIAPIHVTESYEPTATLGLEQPGTSPFVHTRAWQEEVEAAQAAVRRARAQADFVVFSIHWGVPPFYRAPHQGDLAEYQRPLGRALVEAGADLVAGHHPHSLQGIEVHQGKAIVHSLGNFVFDYYVDCGSSIVVRNAPYAPECGADREWCESLILEVTLAEGEVRYDLWPVLLDAAGNPQLLEGEDARRVIERLAGMSAPLGGRVAWEGERGRLLL